MFQIQNPPEQRLTKTEAVNSEYEAMWMPPPMRPSQLPLRQGFHHTQVTRHARDDIQAGGSALP